MRFDYTLTGLGWVSATIADETTSATVTASYLGDALGDLLFAILSLLNGKPEARCSWWEEPGEYRWLFKRDGPQVSLRVVKFGRLWGDEPDASGRLIFETTQDLETLAASIVAGADELLAEHGLEGYRDMWHFNDFPGETLALVKDALAK